MTQFLKKIRLYTEVFFTVGTSHWTTGSSVRSITLSHNTAGIYDMSDLLCFFQWSQYLMPIPYKYVVYSLCEFTPSLNWDTESRMEIVKQWIPQSDLSEQHEHTTILSLLIFFILSQSHHTKFTYLKNMI